MKPYYIKFKIHVHEIDIFIFHFYQYIPRNLSSLVVDDLPPEQLLADDIGSDIESEDIVDIKEEDFDEIPLFQGNIAFPFITVLE